MPRRYQRIRETVHVPGLSRPKKPRSAFCSRTIPHSFPEESHFHFRVCFLSASFIVYIWAVRTLMLLFFRRSVKSIPRREGINRCMRHWHIVPTDKGTRFLDSTSWGISEEAGEVSISRCNRLLNGAFKA